MKRWQRAAAFLLFFVILLCSGGAFADAEQIDAPILEEMGKGEAVQAQEGETISVQLQRSLDDGLVRQIQDTYQAARKRSRRSSFKGYCGAYVANQLVVLGINTSYLSANGNNTFDIYRNMDRTTGGYFVNAYSAKEYTLLEALKAIQGKDPSPCNILVGFEKGTSSAGKKYGHALFIHGIREGRVYYSDSSARTVENVRYKEGEPIVCSLASFVEQYSKYKLDGVVHFEKEISLLKVQASESSSTEETTVTSSEKLAAVD